MLYEQTRHVPLNEITFSSLAVSEAITEIVQRTIQSQNRENRAWPIHPKDRYAGAPEFLTGIYFGAAGVVWALQELKEFSRNNHHRDSLTDLEKISALQATMTVTKEEQNSYFLGQTGIEALRFLLLRRTEDVLKIKQSIAQQKLSGAQELLYGSPGSLNLARLLAERTEDPDYASLAAETLKQLWADRILDEKSEAMVWQQNLGAPLKFFGAGHGTIGNYALLLLALKLCGKEEFRDEIIQNLEKLLKTYAEVDGEFCNWPVFLNSEVTVPSLVHWCHGATGVITSLAGQISKTESPIIHDLLLKGGELLWLAGPLEKGVGLCHGTAGSGMAFLKLYEQTKNRVWLQRARSFAMHAIQQYKSELTTHGQARFSLWTGDLGLAVFLRDTLREKSQMPALGYI